MSDTTKKPMTWTQAFIALLVGMGSGVPITKLKGMFVVFAVVGFVSTPFFITAYKDQYSGHRPPEAPIIKSYGVLKINMALRRPRLEFGTDQGVVYVVGYDSASFHNWVKSASARRVYMEGFLLQDGMGQFWPIYIASEQGETLVSREVLNEKLLSLESSYAGLALLLYSLDLFFWLITIRNMYSLKKNSSKEK